MIIGHPDEEPPSTPVPSISIHIKNPGLLDPPQPACLNEETRAQVTEAIKSATGDRFPQAFFANDCVGTGTDVEEAAAFGVWVDGPANPNKVELDDMMAQLRAPIGRQPGETVAFRFAAPFLLKLAQPSVGRYDGDGNENPNGPTHVEVVWVELKAPDTVVTGAKGFDERPVPDADFTLSITETLTPHAGLFDQLNPQQSFEMDTFFQDILAFTFVFTGWAAPFVYQSYKLHTESPDKKAGVATGLVNTFLGPSIPIPGGKKLNVLYGRSEVNPDAVQIGGNIVGVVDRNPQLTISGAEAVRFKSGQGNAERGYGVASMDDLRPPLTFRWTVDGGEISSGPAAMVMFDAPNPGSTVANAISLTVIDDDRLTATSSISVKLTAEPPGKVHGNPMHEP
jgi:hypothetical protein